MWMIPGDMATNPLDAFAGKSSAGSWRLRICDLYPAADNGNFNYAEIRLKPAPAVLADLSPGETVIGSVPASGGTVTWRLSLTNAFYSSSSTTGVTAKNHLPAGSTFVSASGNVRPQISRAGSLKQLVTGRFLILSLNVVSGLSNVSKISEGEDGGQVYQKQNLSCRWGQFIGARCAADVIER